MRGKQKCKILKEIRQRIADENDIPYVTRECGYQGECKGTCPRCESELQYLERELARRKSLGKRVSVAALCVGMSLAAAGCSPTEKTVEKVEVEILRLRTRIRTSFSLTVRWRISMKATTITRMRFM